MAHHILDGEYPIYYFGQSYLGTVESYIAAGFMKIFGSGVFTLRIGSLVLFCIFLILHGIVVYKFWGSHTALLSLFILALPTWQILWWTFRPTVAACPLIAFGTSILLLSQIRVLRGWYGTVVIFILGVLSGLGVWTHPMILYYVLAFGIVYWLQMPEWSRLHKRLSEFLRAKIHLSPHLLFFSFTLLTFLLLVMTFFTSGCKPQDLFAKLGILSLITLFGLATVLVLLLLFYSNRRKRLIIGGICLASGFVIGNLPQWGSWLFGGVSPSSGTTPTCPTQILTRMKVVFGELLPSMWGIPYFSDTLYLDILHSALWRQPLANIVFWMIVLVILVFLLGWFFWSTRRLFWSMITISPLPEAAKGKAIFGLLFVVPLIVVFLAGNTDIGISAVRYLIISWQAGSVILAISLSRVINFSKIFGPVFIGIWVIQIVWGNLFYIGNIWHQQRDWNSPEAVSAFEEFFEQNRIGGGYADYWISYKMDFLTEERVTLVPYNGVDRYPAYTNRVNEHPLQAFVFSVDSISVNAGEVKAMVDYMNTDYGFGAANRDIMAKLSDMSLVRRQQVSNWDVWLFSKEKQ